MTLALKFDGKKLSHLKKPDDLVHLNKSSDQAYENALRKGDIKAAIAALNEKIYPQQSLNKDKTCSELLIAAHQSAEPALHKKNWSKAIATIEPAWLWCSEQFDGKLPALFKQQPKFILALNDYGFALAENNEFPRAETILNQVVQLNTERTPAYLNLGDALAGQKKDATTAYDNYCQRTQKSKWPKRIVGRSPLCKK